MASDPAIVCAVDSSPRAQHVAGVGRQLAEAVGGRLVLAHVFDPGWIPARPMEEEIAVGSDAVEEHQRQAARTALARTVAAVGDAPHEAVFAEGHPRVELPRILSDHDARLLVVGSEGRKPIDRLVAGSMAAELALEAPCPAAVVTDDATFDGDGPLLAAYDGSEHSMRAARHAAALAAAMRRELVLVHVVGQGDQGVRADADLAAELHAAARACVPTGSGGLDVTVAVEEGDPVEQLLKAAETRDAPLFVVGSRGRNALKAALLGSVSAGLVRDAGKPVVVVGPQSA